MGKDDHTWVSRRLKFHGLPEEIKDFVRQGLLTEGHLAEISSVCVDAHFSSWLTSKQAWEELAKWAVGGVRQAKNLQRRHLSESQRAMVAAKIANLEGPGRPEKITANAVIPQSDVGSLLNISSDSIQRAKKVLTEGTPKP